MTGLAHPAPGHRLTNDFGPSIPVEPDGIYIARDAIGWLRARRRPFAGAVKRNDIHMGDDYGVPIGYKLRALEAGTVYANHYAPGAGYYSLVQINASTAFYLGHLSRFIAKVGQDVTRGQLIDLSGNSGGVPAHVHVGLYHDFAPGPHHIAEWFGSWWAMNLERYLVGGDKAGAAWLRPT